MATGGKWFTLAFESFPFGDTNAIDDLVLAEDLLHGNGLLHVLPDPVHLVGHISTIHLNLHHVRLLLGDSLDQAQLFTDTRKAV